MLIKENLLVDRGYIEKNFVTLFGCGIHIVTGLRRT